MAQGRDDTGMRVTQGRDEEPLARIATKYTTNFLISDILLLAVKRPNRPHHDMTKVVGRTGTCRA